MARDAFSDKVSFRHSWGLEKQATWRIYTVRVCTYTHDLACTGKRRTDIIQYNIETSDIIWSSVVSFGLGTSDLISTRSQQSADLWSPHGARPNLRVHPFPPSPFPHRNLFFGELVSFPRWVFSFSFLPSSRAAAAVLSICGLPFCVSIAYFFESSPYTDSNSCRASLTAFPSLVYNFRETH